MKRTLDELAFRYRLGGLASREIYVEGVQDKVVIEGLGRRLGRSVAVYTSETVEMPHQVLRTRGLECPSARSIVIATRLELAARGIAVEDHIYLVDRDQEDLCPTPHLDGVVLTECGSLLVHFFSDDFLDRFVRIVGRDLISVGQFKDSIFKICRAIYVVRAAARRMGLPVRIISPASFVSGRATVGFRLRSNDYAHTCLCASGLAHRFDDFLAEMQSCELAIDAMALDPRALINDHDLWTVMRVVLGKSGDSVNRSAEDLRDLVLMTLDPAVLEGSLLLSELLR